MNKKQKNKQVVLNNKSRETIKDAQIIEYTLDAFGIKARVLEVDYKEEFNLFHLDIVQGVRVEEIEKLAKTLAMRLVSKTGKVEIIAPIPGKERIGIKVPKKEKKGN